MILLWDFHKWVAKQKRSRQYLLLTNLDGHFAEGEGGEREREGEEEEEEEEEGEEEEEDEEEEKEEEEDDDSDDVVDHDEEEDHDDNSRHPEPYGFLSAADVLRFASWFRTIDKLGMPS